MNLAILVYSASPDAQAPQTALRFARAAIASGHDIAQVFFYGSGVLNLSAFTRPGSGEFNAREEWSELAQHASFELVSCSASAQRRGIIGSKEANSLGLTESVLANSAVSAGLGALIEAIASCDRLVTFT